MTLISANRCLMTMAFPFSPQTQALRAIHGAREICHVVVACISIIADTLGTMDIADQFSESITDSRTPILHKVEDPTTIATDTISIQKKAIAIAAAHRSPAGSRLSMCLNLLVRVFQGH